MDVLGRLYVCGCVHTQADQGVWTEVFEVDVLGRLCVCVMAHRLFRVF